MGHAFAVHVIHKNIEIPVGKLPFRIVDLAKVASLRSISWKLSPFDEASASAAVPRSQPPGQSPQKPNSTTRTIHSTPAFHFCFLPFMTVLYALRVCEAWMHTIHFVRQSGIPSRYRLWS